MRTRTNGKFFAYEHLEPDMLTLAKPLAGGLHGRDFLSSPIAATIQPGDHGTTLAAGRSGERRTVVERGDPTCSRRACRGLVRQAAAEMSRRNDRTGGTWYGFMWAVTSPVSRRRWCTSVRFRASHPLGGGLHAYLPPPLVASREDLSNGL
jgi:hypothetical protein